MTNDPFMPNFFKYADIPVPLKQYICVVAEAKTVEEIPLEDINGFLQMLELRDREILREYDYDCQ